MSCISGYCSLMLLERSENRMMLAFHLALFYYNYNLFYYVAGEAKQITVAEKFTKVLSLLHCQLILLPFVRVNWSVFVERWFYSHREFSEMFGHDNTHY